MKRMRHVQSTKIKKILPWRIISLSVAVPVRVILASLFVFGSISVHAVAGDSRSSTLTGYVLPIHEITFDRGIREDLSVISRPPPKRADFKKAERSRSAQNVADWVADSGDNAGMPFIIVDKIDARVFVFSADRHLSGSAPALLGLAKGDHSFPGIGDKELSAIRPKERTTPAGRFIGLLGHNSDGSNVLWVDHDKAVSLHRVITDQPKERRLQRLATPTPLDNRISYGCINVPVKFYDEVVRPVFANTRGVIYILPEIRSNNEIFESYYEVE
jgi:hypothetical protein